jgi:energy-coupling factor transporter transmembrane protein EcfT
MTNMSMLEPLVRPVAQVARQTVAVSGHVFKHARAISIRDTGSLLVTWLQSLLGTFVDAGHLITRFYRAIKRSALWVIHLPKIIARTISQWISRTGRTIADVCQSVKAAIQAILRGIVLSFKVVLSLLLLYVVVLATRYVYRIYRCKRELQIQRKLHDQVQRKKG